MKTLLWGTLLMLAVSAVSQGQKWRIDNLAEWEEATERCTQINLMESNDWGGVIDLMGNGALLLEKISSENLFTHTTVFHTDGEWVSPWHDFGEKVSLNALKFDLIIYGKKMDMRKGWIKFSKNPVLSGGNRLLPLNSNNVTDQTILLPDPGGVPQDQAIIRGKSKWSDKWVLFFNHTPSAWPENYYWSITIADSLTPLKRGTNPFIIDSLHYPLYGPIDNQAPNDWIEVNGVYYAPDETHQGNSHMWESNDMLTWKDLGEIEGINGSDPGITYDGQDFYLFNEANRIVNYNRLASDMLSVIEGGAALDVGDHTGDCDVAFFNNAWHMFMDDGIHLHYQIAYAFTTAESFPLGWELYNKIYGPHNPEQGQTWDDDTPEGNEFGTGDADIALEGTTLYMFTERPIGVAYKELTEVLDGEEVEVMVNVLSDTNGDGVADDSTGWHALVPGQSAWSWSTPLPGRYYKVIIKMISTQPSLSPMIRFLELSG